MGTLAFLCGYLFLAFVAGLLTANARRRWLRHSALVLSAALPALLWLGLSVRDAILFDRPVFDLISESGRFGFYVGGILAILATPVWLLMGFIGRWAGKRAP